MSDSMGGRERIVVGVDGSTPSIHALEWALKHAEKTGAKLEAVKAWQVPTTYGSGVMVLPGGEEFDSAAKQALDRAVSQAVGPVPLVEVEQRTVEGHPAKVLIEESNTADLLVVGSRGHGGFVGALIGSVSQYCIGHAECPVVVVRTKE